MTSRPEIVLIVARADNGVIGRDGALPWRLTADLKRFKRLTADHPMVMGRKTFESLPGLLPGRRHIVLTRDNAWCATGAEVAHDVNGALSLAAGPVVAVIGGAEIYRLFMAIADRVELTEVHAEPEGDTVMPALDEWREVARESHAAEEGQPGYDFVTLAPLPLGRGRGPLGKAEWEGEALEVSRKREEKKNLTQPSPKGEG